MKPHISESAITLAQWPAGTPRSISSSGARASLHLLETERAASWLEIEAKIADRRYAPIEARVEPHHLSGARAALVREELVTVSESATRGGSSVPIFHLPDAKGRRFEDASARKRMLTARYYGWAKGTRSRPGRVGPAGEAALHAALQVAGPSGYRLVSPGRNVEELLGVKLFGPLTPRPTTWRRTRQASLAK